MDDVGRFCAVDAPAATVSQSLLPLSFLALSRCFPAFCGVFIFTAMLATGELGKLASEAATEAGAEAGVEADAGAKPDGILDTGAGFGEHNGMDSSRGGNAARVEAMVTGGKAAIAFSTASFVGIATGAARFSSRGFSFWFDTVFRAL